MERTSRSCVDCSATDLLCSVLERAELRRRCGSCKCPFQRTKGLHDRLKEDTRRCMARKWERDKPKGAYANLKFHCDWVLHAKLTGRGRRTHSASGTGKPDGWNDQNQSLRSYLFSYDGKQYGPMLNVASKEKAKLVRPDEAGPHNSTRDPRGKPPSRTASSSMTPLGWSSTSTRR